MVEADEYYSREDENGGGDEKKHITEIEKLLVPGGPPAPRSQGHHT